MRARVSNKTLTVEICTPLSSLCLKQKHFVLISRNGDSSSSAREQMRAAACLSRRIAADRTRGMFRVDEIARNCVLVAQHCYIIPFAAVGLQRRANIRGSPAPRPTSSEVRERTYTNL